MSMWNGPRVSNRSAPRDICYSPIYSVGSNLTVMSLMTVSQREHTVRSITDLIDAKDDWMTISAVHDRIDKEPTKLEKGPRKSVGYALSSLLSTCAWLQTGFLFCIIKCAVLHLWRVSSMPRAPPQRVHSASLPPSNTQRTPTTSMPRECPSQKP